MADEDLKKQRALDVVTASFPQPLKGDEDDHQRRRWANMVEARKAVWPTGLLKIELLFDVALEGRAWQEYAVTGESLSPSIDRRFQKFCPHITEDSNLYSVDSGSETGRARLHNCRERSNTHTIFKILILGRRGGTKRRTGDTLRANP